MKNWTANILSSLAVILIPPVIILSIARLLLTPAFPGLEYRMPGFPDDPYGFTLQDRLVYSKLSIEYLLNDSDISFFEPFTLPGGSPLYNDRELSHMDDVKVLFQLALKIWKISVASLGLIILALLLQKKLPVLLKVFKSGGFLTIALLVALLISVALDFSAFFTWFHSLFFEGDTWIFYYSDTFIRLFPIRFWQDCFIYAGTGSILVSLLLIFQPFLNKMKQSPV